ncbi:hypothetical protein ACA910_013316 [Epithemia clementina (nom. ined.)]
MKRQGNGINSKGRGKRRNRSKGQRSSNRSSNESISTAIDQQLELQRLQSRSANEQQDVESVSTDRQVVQRTLGNFRYDPERNAYFPSSSYVDSNHLKRSTDEAIGISESSRVTITTRDNFAWLFSRQECMDNRQKKMLASFGCSHSYLDRIKLTESASAFRSHPRRRTVEWRTLFGPKDYDDEINVDDLTCKIHRPAWLRTFDVLSHDSKINEPRQPGSRPGDHDSTRSNNPAWQVATVVEDGYEIRSRSSQGRARREFFASGFAPQQVRYMHFAPMSDGVPSGGKTALAAIISREIGSSAVDLIFPTSDETDDDETQLRYNFARPINDVVEYGCSGFLLASPKQHAPYFVSFRGHGMTPILIRNPVPSEILCMECAGRNKKQYYFGHRNGIVSLYDERSPQLASIVAKCQGSITCLLPRNDMADGCGDYLLARSQNLTSNCPCTLWDVRRPLHSTEFNLPSSSLPRLTNKCNGMAVDEYGTTLFSPYVDKSNNEETPCLGVWSLLSAEWIGFRRLATSSTDDIPLSSAAAVSWVELCSTRTSAWEWSRDLVSTGSEHFGLKTAGGGRSFGLWYKCGQSPSAHKHPGLLQPTDAGNIHHIVV